MTDLEFDIYMHSLDYRHKIYEFVDSNSIIWLIKIISFDSKTYISVQETDMFWQRMYSVDKKHIIIDNNVSEEAIYYADKLVKLIAFI